MKWQANKWNMHQIKDMSFLCTNDKWNLFKLVISYSEITQYLHNLVAMDKGLPTITFVMWRLGVRKEIRNESKRN